MSAVESLLWPMAQAADALAALGHSSGYAPHAEERAGASGRIAMPAKALSNAAQRAKWMRQAAETLGLEIEPVEANSAGLDRMLAGCAPALLQSLDAGNPSLLAVVRSRRGEVTLLAPTGRTHRVDGHSLDQVLLHGRSAVVAPELDELLGGVGVSAKRRRRAQEALAEQTSGDRTTVLAWLVRAGSAVRPQIREARLTVPAAVFVVSHALSFALWIASWALLGAGALSGHLDRGWLVAWGLMLLTLIPFRAVTVRAGGVLAIRAGALLKRRLLSGALRMDPDEIRGRGAGELLGQALEAEAVEQLAVTGGLYGITAVIELVLAAAVLAAGADAWLELVSLVLWIAVCAGLGLRYLDRRRHWTAARIALTHQFVEGMVGHRTRAVQQPRSHWTEAEDASLAAYSSRSIELDRASRLLITLLARGWFALAILGLAPAFVFGDPALPAFAIAAGGVLLAYGAFGHLAEGFDRCLAAAVSWEQVRELWRAAARTEPPGRAEYASTGSSAEAVEKAPPPHRSETSGEAPGAPLIDLRAVAYRYPGRAKATLEGIALQVFQGERLLLLGASGSGKSTLTKILAGMCAPDEGIRLLNGLDWDTVGARRWREQVALVPPFHENHVLSGTLAFNLLMGRAWPPSNSDLKAAEDVCRALGLGPLLERMPSGLQQWVGETGWQLSHGERDRICIARALLQRANMLILDESLAALDPHTLGDVFEALLERAPTLVLIAHP
jgi:ATP-binding cassette, subfamily B, bacterial